MMRTRTRMRMRIISAKIVHGFGTDKVFLQTTLPSSLPTVCVQELVVSFDAAAGSGRRYVENHFPNIPIEVIEIPSAENLR